MRKNGMYLMLSVVFYFFIRISDEELAEKRENDTTKRQ